MAEGARNHKYGGGREALLEAVVHVVAEKGLRGMTYRAVAERAGVNNTLIAHHFGTRDALLGAAVEWATDRSVQMSDLSVTADLGPEFARALVDLVRSEPELQVFQFEMIFESRRRPELRPAVVGLYETYIESLRHVLEQGGFDRTESLARAIFAALDGLVIQQLAIAEEDSEVVYDAILRIGELLENQPRTR